MLSIVLCSLRVSHLVTLFHQLLMEYFKLEIGFDAFLMSWKSCGVSFPEKTHIAIALHTPSLSFGLAQASVLVGNLLSLEQG